MLCRHYYEMSINKQYSDVWCDADDGSKPAADENR